MSESGATEIGHAQRPQSASRVILDEVEGSDIGMLQAGQGEVFVGLGGRELEDDEAVSQGELTRQKDRALGTASEFGQEQEVAQGFAGRGELRRRTLLA